MVKVASKATILIKRIIMSILVQQEEEEVVEASNLKVILNGMVTIPPCKPILAHLLKNLRASMITVEVMVVVAAEVAVVRVEVVADFCQINTKETLNSSYLHREIFLISLVNVSAFINFMLSSF